MMRRILLLVLLGVVLAILCNCGGQGVPPGSSGATAVNGGALTVQLTQGPPVTLTAGQSVGLFATVFNDKNNAGVTWSCSPASACGSFSPATTGYQIDTLYTAPVAPPNGPIAPNLVYPVTITATSVSDNTKTSSVTVNIAQQYAFVLNTGYGGWGVAGSVTLDGSGHVLAGEADYETNGGLGHLTVTPSSTPGSASFYTLDATGHGILSLDFSGPGFKSDVETHGITATSNSHLLIAEEDQFNGFSYGDSGSMDLQTAGPTFSGAQISGGYSFTLSGYSGAMHENSSWGGIFTADGTATAATPGNITGGIFDENTGNNGGGPGYNSEPTGSPVGAAGLPFTGTYTAPDSNGRGVITLSTSPDTLGPCGGPSQPTCTQYAYYLVTPEVLRLMVLTNTGNGANGGSAYGQGTLSVAANDTNAALTGGFIFSSFGFGDNNNGGDSSAAAGQFATDGKGLVTGGIMDTNVANGGTGNALGVVTTGIPLSGSVISISGSPRGALITPSGQIYNLYLTDPNLNLLDPNNSTGGGGALLFEASNTSAAQTYGNSIGMMIPQANAATASLAGNYALLLSQESNVGGCCSNDSGFTGDFTLSGTTAGTFSGEGDFQGTGNNAENQCCQSLETAPLTGTFSADATNPGHFTGTVTTTPVFPTGAIGSTTPGTLNVDFFLASGSQGFLIETDAVAPSFGVVEVQGTIQPGAQKRLGASRQRLSSTAGARSAHLTNKQHLKLSGGAQ